MKPTKDEVLNLKNAIGPSKFSSARDIIRVKEILYLNNLYPRARIDGSGDRELYDGIRKFQQAERLVPDSTIHPGGPTDKALAIKSPTYRCVKCGAPHGGLFGVLCPSCGIKSGVAPVS